MSEQTPEPVARSVVPPPPRTRTSPFGEVVRLGARWSPLQDIYHTLMRMRWAWLLVAIAAAYLVVNTLFAGLYLLGGDCIENAAPGSFRDAFFFSVQTMATIGYGKMVPRTSYSNALVAFEALTGIVAMAMATGLMFAKFARPTARVLFSNIAVVSKRDGVTSLMFRMANERGNQIVEANLRIVLSRNEVTHEGERVRRFHDLTLSRDRNAAFVLSWTAIHPITPTSPLNEHTPQSLRDEDCLIIVSLVGIDDTSGQTVNARHVYSAEDVRFGLRFVDIISVLPDGRRQIDYTEFHATQPLD